MEYITSKGDTWDLIAYKTYGDASIIAPIIEANPAHVETVVFDYGVKLIIPKIEKTDDSVYMPPWRSE